MNELLDFTDGEPAERLVGADKNSLPDGWKQGNPKGILADSMASHDHIWHKEYGVHRATFLAGVRLNPLHSLYEPLRCIKTMSAQQVMTGHGSHRYAWQPFPGYPMFDTPIAAMIWLELKADE